MKLNIRTLASELSPNSSIDDVRDAVKQLKSMISVWHRQDVEDINDAIDDWGGFTFACIMKDGTKKFAYGTLDEGYDGSVYKYLDIASDEQGSHYSDNDIDMWCLLPWDPNMYISGVFIDDVEIQKGPQSADQFKRRDSQ